MFVEPSVVNVIYMLPDVAFTALGTRSPLNSPRRNALLLVPSYTLTESYFDSVWKLLKVSVIAEPVVIVHWQDCWDEYLPGPLEMVPTTLVNTTLPLHGPMVGDCVGDGVGGDVGLCVGGVGMAVGISVGVREENACLSEG